MPRPKNLNPPTLLHVAIDQDLKDRLSLVLYSELEQTIPKGAWRRFIEARIREWFDWRQQDLAPYGFPQGYFITGPTEMTEAVINRLKGKQHGTI